MRTLPAWALALAMAAPAPAFAQEKAPITLVRAPRTLDVPREATWIAPETLAPFATRPAPREIKLSEEGLVLVVASCIIGGIILIYLVSRAT